LRLAQPRELFFEKLRHALFHVNVSAPRPLLQLLMLHMRHVAVGATYWASLVRVEREAAHARAIQHRTRLNDVELDGPLWLALRLHSQSISRWPERSNQSACRAQNATAAG